MVGKIKMMRTMQKQDRMDMKKVESGRTIIFPDQKKSKLAEPRFFHFEKPRFQRNHDFSEPKNLGSGGIKVFQDQKTSIPPVSTFFNGKKSPCVRFQIVLKGKTIYPHCFESVKSRVNGRRFASSVFYSIPSGGISAWIK